MVLSSLGDALPSPLSDPRVLLEHLHLPHAAAALPIWLERAAHEELGYSEFLGGLLEEESAARASLETERRLRQAGFPYVATIEQFDFRFRPELKRQVIVFVNPVWPTLMVRDGPPWLSSC